MATDFYKQFKRNAEMYDLLPRGAKVLQWYSGGKDSNVLLDILMKYRQEWEFSLDVYLVTIPHMVYKSEDPLQADAMRSVLAYWKNRGVNIQVVAPILPDGSAYPDDSYLDHWKTKCYSCEKIKTASLSKIVANQSENCIIATPHSVYDILGYVMELAHICGGLAEGWKSVPEDSEEYERMMILARRCYPKVEVEGRPSLTYIRPLINLPSNEFIVYDHREGIPIIPECCRDLGGDAYIPFKRLPMQAADLLAKLNPEPAWCKRFADDYDRIMQFADSARIMPPIEAIAPALKGKTGV